MQPCPTSSARWISLSWLAWRMSLAWGISVSWRLSSAFGDWLARGTLRLGVHLRGLWLARGTLRLGVHLRGLWLAWRTLRLGGVRLQGLWLALRTLRLGAFLLSAFTRWHAHSWLCSSLAATTASPLAPPSAPAPFLRHIVVLHGLHRSLFLFALIEVHRTVKYRCCKTAQYTYLSMPSRPSSLLRYVDAQHEPRLAAPVHH